MAQGDRPAEAYWRTAHAIGEVWERREGDPNYYGTVGCTECFADKMCGLCQYAEGRWTTVDRMLTILWQWERGQVTPTEIAQAAHTLVERGLLDSVEDPEGDLLINLMGQPELNLEVGDTGSEVGE